MNAESSDCSKMSVHASTHCSVTGCEYCGSDNTGAGRDEHSIMATVNNLKKNMQTIKKVYVLLQLAADWFCSDIL